MKRPVWRYAQEATTNAPLEVVLARLESFETASPLSVCAPRLGGRGPSNWHQESWSAVQPCEAGFQRCWSARQGGLQEEASLRVLPAAAGCLLRAEGKLKGWPLLWKVGLLGWRSEGLLQRFVDSL